MVALAPIVDVTRVLKRLWSWRSPVFDEKDYDDIIPIFFLRIMHCTKVVDMLIWIDSFTQKKYNK